MTGKISVYKNTFLKRAIQDTVLKQFNNKIAGPIIVATSSESSPLLTKKIYQFLKKVNPKSEIIASFYDGDFYEKEAIQELALLPSRDELLQQIMSTLLTPLWNLNSLLMIKQEVDNLTNK